ncbi:MAG: phosphoglycolate phosphatase [Pseudomonadota bacterium]
MTAVLFDLDGTLIDSLPNVRDAANAVLNRYGLPDLPSGTVAGFVGLGEQVFIDRLIAATDLNAVDRDEIMARFILHYKEEAKKTLLFPGVKSALASLKKKGFALGLVTNKPRAPLEPTLDAAGLRSLFDVVVAGDDLPKRKPDPAQLLHAVEALDVPGAVYVGDSETDAASAQNANMPFVLFTEGIRLSPIEDLPHVACFDDFADLPELIFGLDHGRS